MNKNETRVPARFGPERGSKCGRLRRRRFRHAGNRNRAAQKSFARAATGRSADAGVEPSAAARGQRGGGAAWATVYPSLVFPAPFEEKTRAALRQAERQARIFESTRELLAV